MNVEMLSNQYLEKDFPSSLTGVEPMTFQNTGWNSLNTELLGTRGELSHILGSYV